MKIDFINGEVYPADFVVSRQLDDPLVVEELMGLAEEAELMGIDLDDPEIMGAWLKNVIGKIKSRIKKRKGGSVSAKINTGSGTLDVGPQGVQWTDPVKTTTSGIQAALNTPQMTAAAGVATALKNPWVIGAGAGLLFLMLTKKKGGRR